MKFDSNGKKIVVKNGISVSEEYLNKVKKDVEVIAKHLGTSIPKVKLQNGFGGKCYMGRDLISVGFGDAEYNNKIREIIVHEMLHHKGFKHGKVMGYSFMSHSDNDHISPRIVEKIFN